MARILVNIDVDDLERAVAFYSAAFDLTPARRFGDAVTEMVGAEAAVYLLRKSPGTAPFPGGAEARSYARHWTPVHLDFVVDDLEVALARAVGAGARTEGEVGNHDWGRIAYLCDPFGHGFCLIQMSGRGYDEIATPAAATIDEASMNGRR
jgi:predicted enzyme related to lactoylglutathione lyase